MSRLTLYTTLGCHLCEQLEAELARLGADDIELQRIEIADDEALIERFGTRIPVLADAAGELLERGFDAERLAAWLDARGLLAPRRVDSDAPTSSPRGARQVKGRRFLG